MSQIICENLSPGCGSNIIIRDLNFCVDPGEYLCITGENGSGKSTLVKAVLGLKAPLSGCQGKSFFHPFYNSNDRRLASESMSKMNISDLAGTNQFQGLTLRQHMTCIK